RSDQAIQRLHPLHLRAKLRSAHALRHRKSRASPVWFAVGLERYLHTGSGLSARRRGLTVLATGVENAD
ncbi:MAG TPA: hypothetical protein VKB76_02420, partial [Ktedonobacterales bacterium]|nr:hypothetical protein [Ktedonobacterales bacterium]